MRKDENLIWPVIYLLMILFLYVGYIEISLVTVKANSNENRILWSILTQKKKTSLIFFCLSSEKIKDCIFKRHSTLTQTRLLERCEETIRDRQANIENTFACLNVCTFERRAGRASEWCLNVWKDANSRIYRYLRPSTFADSLDSRHKKT